MLIGNFRIHKKFSVRKKTLEISFKSKNETIYYLFSGEDVFTGDYWNSVYFNCQLYDVNFSNPYEDKPYYDYKLSIYKVTDGVADYSNFINV